MAIEEIRHCGYRKVGGTYLVGGLVSHICDRLPMLLEPCPLCGQGFSFNRGVTKFDAYLRFGFHRDCLCSDCNVCQPPAGISFIMWVGKSHYKTPGLLLEEAHRLGISRRIASIPNDLELGRTVIYLAHREAVNGDPPAASQGEAVLNGNHLDYQPRMFETEQKPEPKPGIFAAFVPWLIERLVWQRDATEERLEKWRERGITPVIVPNGDIDHAPEPRI